MTDALPHGVVHYATSHFTHETLPEKLRKDHCTKAGVWGQLVVQSGQVLLCRDGKEDLVLSAGDRAVFAPQETHSANPIGAVAFEVRFHRQESTDAIK